MLNFFKRILDAFIEARRLQAAFNLANHLKATNRDFKNWSHSELVHYIMKDDEPVTLDKKPVKAQNDEQVELAQAA